MMMKRHLRQILLTLCVLAAMAAGAGARVGIAWQPNPKSYARVVDAIEAAGGEAVILDQVMPVVLDYDGVEVRPEFLDEIGILRQEYADVIKRDTWHGSNVVEAMKGVDAVVFLGGGDVCPTLFAVPQTGHGIEEDCNFDAARDVSEYLTMAYCLDHDLAVLGICRGMQLLGIVSGAPLIQDLGTYFDGMDIEYQYMHRAQRDSLGNRHYVAHDVAVTDSLSLFYGIAKTDTVRSVPSWHHQVVGNVEGTALKVTGVTRTQGVDIIEVIERTDKRFALGVQFHPEEALRRIFAREPDADSFMPYESAIAYFRAIVGN